MNECRHPTWNVVHAVFRSEGRGPYLVRRWCPMCGVEQVGVVTTWRKPKRGEFDRMAEVVADEESLRVREADDG